MKSSNTIQSQCETQETEQLTAELLHTLSTSFVSTCTNASPSSHSDISQSGSLSKVSLNGIFEWGDEVAVSNGNDNENEHENDKKDDNDNDNNNDNNNDNELEIVMVNEAENEMESGNRNEKENENENEHNNENDNENALVENPSDGYEDLELNPHEFNDLLVDASDNDSLQEYLTDDKCVD